MIISLVIILACAVPIAYLVGWVVGTAPNRNVKREIVTVGESEDGYYYLNDTEKSHKVIGKIRGVEVVVQRTDSTSEFLYLCPQADGKSVYLFLSLDR